jgi:hypothetical protein
VEKGEVTMRDKKKGYEREIVSPNQKMRFQRREVKEEMRCKKWK